MNIAILFSGEIRQLNSTKDYWLKIKEKYNADIFGSFWNNYENDDTIENFINIYNPVRYEVESQDIIKDTFVNQLMNDVNIPYVIINDGECERIKNGNILYMTYKIWRSNSLTKLVDKKYSIVIRARTDITFNKHLNLKEIMYFNIPSGFTILSGMEKHWGFLDLFSYAKPEIMDYYSSFIFHFIKYIKDGFFVWTPEYMLRIHLSQKKLKINQFANHLYLHRKNEIVNVNSYLDLNQPSNLIDLEQEIPPIGYNCYRENFELYKNI